MWIEKCDSGEKEKQNPDNIFGRTDLIELKLFPDRWTIEGTYANSKIDDDEKKSVWYVADWLPLNQFFKRGIVHQIGIKKAQWGIGGASWFERDLKEHLSITAKCA